MKTTKTTTMTLEDFQRKLFWIALSVLTPVIAVCVYVIL